LGYQWQFNNADINGATGDTFAKTNAQFTDAGAYRVRVTDSVGTRTSRAAQVTVLSNAVRVAVELQRTNVVISWPVSPGGVILEETTDLTPPAIWRTSALTPANEGDRWQIVAPILSTTNTYFRLKRSP
jgi:hypothetical protein